MSNSQIKVIFQRLVDCEKRIASLEKLVLIKKTLALKRSQNNYSGPTGGVRYIYENGFFKERRNFLEVRKKLGDEGYHYSPQAIQMALTRLSKVEGVLVSLKDMGKKVYVERK